MPKSQINIESLIEALTIAKKYLDPEEYAYSYPTHCEHDVMHLNIDITSVSDEDKKRLNELSFNPRRDEEGEDFRSYHFGSA